MEQEVEKEAFIAFLTKKKINSQAFQTSEPKIWHDLAEQFLILGVNGFDQRKKFFINNWRIRYPL
jgi:hypothetical protein